MFKQFHFNFSLVLLFIVIIFPITKIYGVSSDNSLRLGERWLTAVTAPVQTAEKSTSQAYSEFGDEHRTAILQVWWDRYWVKMLVFLAVFVLVLYVLLSYAADKIKTKNMLDTQQQSVRLERQRISSEIHDDIGSGIFAIQLYAEMANRKTKNNDLIHISSMITDLSEKIREVIWTTNIENDDLENLIYFIQFTMEKLFEHTVIEFESSIPEDIPELCVDSHTRRNVHLVIKELAHNAIKHSLAKHISLKITIEDELLVMILKDDGVGFNMDNLEKAGMGLENMRQRVHSLRGSFSIENYKGTLAMIRIPLKEMTSDEIIYKQSFWKLFNFDFRKAK